MTAVWATLAVALSTGVTFLTLVLLRHAAVAPALADQILLAISNLVMAGGLFGAIRWNGVSAANYLALHRPRFAWILIATAGVVAIQWGGDWSAHYFGAGTTDANWEVEQTRRLAASNWATGLAILNVPLLAPATEEVMFRGFLFRGWAASPLGGAATVLLTSIVFGLLHLQYTWHGMTVVTLIGLWFGFVRWRSQSLVPSLVAHCLANGLATLLLALTVT